LISSTFNAHFFGTKVLCEAFLKLHFGLVIFFLAKKVFFKMLVKSTTGVSGDNNGTPLDQRQLQGVF
jgi:hypothetical protein